MSFLLFLVLPWIKIFKDGYKTEFFVCIGFLVFCPILGFLIPFFSFFGGIGFAWNIAVLWMIYLARHDVKVEKDLSMAYTITGGVVGNPPKDKSSVEPTAT